MHNNLKGLIELLEGISEGVGEDFIFQVGFVLRDKTEKYRIAFRRQDYDLLLAELRILLGITGYVTSYDYTWTYVTYIYPIEDADTNGYYSAEEYYPLLPFGTILEDGADMLVDARDSYLQGLEDVVESWDLILERAFQAPNESVNEILSLPVGGLGSAVLDDQKKLYDDFATRFNDTLEMALDGRGGSVEVKVTPSALFQDSIGDVRAILPCVDTMGNLIPCEDAAEIWPDATFAGLFPEGLTDDSTVIRMGKVKGKAASSDYLLYEEGTISYPGGESKISENGEFLLAGVEFNELIGLQITLTPKEGEPWDGSIHSMWEYVYTMPELVKPTGGPGGMEGLVPPGLGGTSTPGGGRGPGTETDGDGDGDDGQVTLFPGA
jgi:hypothetical protein